MSVTDGTWRRYSLVVSRRRAKPRAQPSIIASEKAHAHDVAHATHGMARHGSRWATDGPHSATPRPIAIAGIVPQPTWTFHHPKMGAIAANDAICLGVLLISGVTIPRPRWGTANAATTRRIARLTTTISRMCWRPMDFTPIHPMRRAWRPLVTCCRRDQPSRHFTICSTIVKS